MNISFLTDKIQELARESKSEEVRLLALIIQVKSEFDSDNITELKEMHRQQLEILENHTKILDKLTNRISEQDDKIAHNEEQIKNIKDEFERWKQDVIETLVANGIMERQVIVTEKI